MKYLIQAELHAELTAPVREHHIQLRLAPWVDDWQKVEECSIEVEPFAEPISHRDGFGNPAHNLALLGAHTGIAIRLRTQVQTLLINPFDYRPVPTGREPEWIAHSLRQAPRLWDFVLHRSAAMPDLSDLGLREEIPQLVSGTPLIEQVQAAMEWVSRVRDERTEEEDKEPGPPAMPDDRYSGSLYPVRLLIALVRRWGIPARFATGYVDPVFFEPDDEGGPQPRPQSMHAWADVLIPGAGWRGFDPVAGLVVNDTYVRVAVGRDADDVVPERAAFTGEGAQAEIALAVDVARG